MLRHLWGGGGKTKRTLVVASFLLALVAGPAVASNGARLTSYGARAAGRGGVDYAFADDATAPATNPAGIAFTPNRFDNNWLAAIADGQFRNQQGVFHMSPQWQVPFPAYSFGVVIDPTQSWHVGDLFDFGNWGLKPEAKDPPRDGLEDLWLAQNKDAPKESSPSKKDELPPPPRPTVPIDDATDEELYGGRFRFGFGVFPVSGGAFTYKHIITPFTQPNAIRYRTRAEQLAIAPTFAFRIIGTKDLSLSFGYSPQFHYAKFKLDGPIQQPNTTLNPSFRFSSIFLGSTSLLTYATTHDLSTYGFSQRLGFMLNLDKFSVGVTYQDRTYLQDYLGSAEVDANQQVARLTNGNPGLLQIVDPRVDPARGFRSEYDMRIKNLQQPRQFGLGFAFRPMDRVALGLDYTFIGWEELYRVFAVRLTNGSNQNLDIMTSPSVKVRVPLKYHNQHVIAIGGSVVVLRGDDIVPDVPSFQLILRAGYNWGQTPTRANTNIPQTPIIFEHHLSGGLTFQLGPYLDFTFAVEHAFHNGVHTGISRSNSDLSFSRNSISLTQFFFGTGVNF
ncbi:MAG: OmpP1/FadL family transporter [Planctomycetota bacterium]